MPTTENIFQFTETMKILHTQRKKNKREYNHINKAGKEQDIFTQGSRGQTLYCLILYPNSPEQCLIHGRHKKASTKWGRAIATMNEKTESRGWASTLNAEYGRNTESLWLDIQLVKQRCLRLTLITQTQQPVIHGKKVKQNEISMIHPSKASMRKWIWL